MVGNVFLMGNVLKRMYVDIVLFNVKNRKLWLFVVMCLLMGFGDESVDLLDFSVLF